MRGRICICRHRPIMCALRVQGPRRRRPACSAIKHASLCRRDTVAVEVADDQPGLAGCVGAPLALAERQFIQIAPVPLRVPQGTVRETVMTPLYASDSLGNVWKLTDQSGRGGRWFKDGTKALCTASDGCLTVLDPSGPSD